MGKEIFGGCEGKEDETKTCNVTARCICEGTPCKTSPFLVSLTTISRINEIGKLSVFDKRIDMHKKYTSIPKK